MIDRPLHIVEVRLIHWLTTQGKRAYILGFSHTRSLSFGARAPSSFLVPSHLLGILLLTSMLSSTSMSILMLMSMSQPREENSQLT